MRQRIPFVGADRRFVVVERIERMAVLEQEIADVDQGRRAALIAIQRERKGLERLVAPGEGDERNAALVVHARPFGARRRTRERRGKFALGRRMVARLEGDHAAFEGAGRVRAPAPRGNQTSHVELGHRTVLHVDVVTLFPEMFAPAIGLSILGRAQERGAVCIEIHHLLDALGPHERADDRPFGGGPGMVLRLEPLARTLDGILERAPQAERRAIVVTSAAGRPFGQPDAQDFARLDRLVIVCGHYEGIDDRLTGLYGAREVSLGPFVLTGGEIPALAILDATVRLAEGAINPASLEYESHGPDGLDAPAYTRPARFRGAEVPAVLLSGDHAKIAQWRREEARRRTIARNTLDPSE